MVIYVRFPVFESNTAK